jgi:high-affinity iron transporter
VLTSLFITLREGLEAALIVAVVLAYLRQVDASASTRPVWLGVAVAAGVSLVAGGVLFLTGSELTGSAEALFEISVMIAAVAVLTFMMLWMQRQAATQGARLRRDVHTALALGGGALFWLAFLAVVREGFESALFLFAAAGDASPLATLAGGLAGLLLAFLAGYAVYRGSAKLPLRTFFTLTNVVLVGFAIYLVWSAVGELGELLGGEAFELLGPVAAAVYGVLMTLGLRRTKRAAQRATPPAVATCESRAA